MTVSAPEGRTGALQPSRWLRAVVSLIGLPLYCGTAWLVVGLFLLLAGPWQVKEMGDGPDRPFWLVATAYGFAIAGLAAYCVACFRWIRGR